jgi:hypothetical protein
MILLYFSNISDFLRGSVTNKHENIRQKKCSTNKQIQTNTHTRFPAMLGLNSGLVILSKIEIVASEVCICVHGHKCVCVCLCECVYLYIHNTWVCVFVSVCVYTGSSRPPKKGGEDECVYTHTQTHIGLDIFAVLRVLQCEPQRSCVCVY